MTKLLISLPLSDAAQKFYGSTAPTYNKVGNAGVDLPFVNDVKPYDTEVAETLGVISFDTIFAMYDGIEGFPYYEMLGWIQDKDADFFSILSPSHFDIRPRSSISKTPFRLANSVGTIDSTYRGIKVSKVAYWEGDTLGAYLDYHPQLGKQNSYCRGETIRAKPSVSAGDRLLQIVAPALDSILHIKLDFTDENCRFWCKVIGDKQRNGFGSSGV